MLRIGASLVVLAVASAAGSAWAQAPTNAAAGGACDTWATTWSGAAAVSVDANALLDIYKRIPRTCVAERADALMRIGQVARANGFLLEAAADGSPIVRRATPVIPPAPVVAAPQRAPTVVDADLTAQPGRRDFENPPSALQRLSTPEAVIVVAGVLTADGSFDWTVQSETPANSGLQTYALRLADRFRARTTRPDGASLVGATITRTFRFRPTT